ncbi:MAG TPA: cytochrome c oxidase subunit 3 family protein [Vicinamibacterales bacterium]|nr:cytochrome c oxidase subunit 3 family protein [Vicinamibacterales bacterium]
MSDGHAHAAALHGGAPHEGHHPRLQEQFDDMGQQAEASTLGMWVFLSTEIMFFGGLFMCYLVYRTASPSGFAEASHSINLILGAINTGVLICSSLTMALAVRAAQTSAKPRTQVTFLLITMCFGVVFLGIKAYEYYEKFREHHVPGPYFHWEGQYPKAAEMFLSLYFAMTGLHALHMIIGLGIMTVITVMAWRGSFDEEYYTPVEVSGLYWHFVDIVWIFLFPLLYLIGGHYQ